MEYSETVMGIKPMPSSLVIHDDTRLREGQYAHVRASPNLLLVKHELCVENK